MASQFEKLLLSSNALDRRIGREVISWLAVGGALTKLRAISRPLKDLAETDMSALFQTLYIETLPNGDQSIRSLTNIAGHCRHLVIRIESNPRVKSSMPPSSVTIASRLNTPLSYPSKVDHDLLRQWVYLFSLFTGIRTMTIATNGDPGWPGFTSIEALLIILRISIERSRLRSLRHLRLSPIHAMGILHFRWAGGAAYGEVPASFNTIWQKLESLELQVLNPHGLSRPQQYVFEKCLKDYLGSFKRTLKVLKFAWMDGDGFDPFAEDPFAKKWACLKEVWLGSGVAEESSRANIKRVAPELSSVRVLKLSTSFNERGTTDFENARCWAVVHAGGTAKQHPSESSSPEPRRSRSLERSDSDSMMVPFMLDF